MNGDVTVTITFENGVATACDVDASTETESLGQAAAPTVRMPSWLATPPTWTL